MHKNKNQRKPRGIFGENIKILTDCLWDKNTKTYTKLIVYVVSYLLKSARSAYEIQPPLKDPPPPPKILIKLKQFNNV